MKIILLLLTLKACFCDWVSEWLAPVEFQYKDFSTQNLSDAQFFKNPLTSDIEQDNQYEPLHRADVETFAPVPSSNLLKVKLEEILKNAKTLTATLKKQITYIENQERFLKEAIATGRSGTTTLTVTTLAQNPRTYFIRNGYWTLCNGIVQYPIATQQHSVFTELLSSPRCIGQEVKARRDFCAFNSLIKYETVPTTKRSTYIEDNYLCLKPSFNDTIETYMSVPKRIVDETCKNGVIKTLPENLLDCGLRVLLEYAYYPTNRDLSSLPLEYCTEKDGACKLTIGWHLSNTSIQNFEFLKAENNFKKFFIKSDHYLEPII